MKIILFHVAILVLIQASVINSATLSCQSSSGPCSVSTITPLTSSNEEIVVSGQPANFVDSLTTSLSFTQPNRLNFVPSKVFKIFPKVNTVSFSNVSITSVTSNAFVDCGNLISISLNNNDFPVLPASFASTCINVTNFYATTNGIKELDNDAFKGLTFLNFFSASYNNITCIPPGLFQNTPVISYIDLGYNQISEIDPRALRNLPNLNNLNLANNKIVNLPALDFTGSALTFGFNLQFNDNPFKSISPQFITKVFANRYGGGAMASVFLSSSSLAFLNITTCLPKNTLYGYIYSSNWPVANISLTECYANWRVEYQTNPVSCVGNVGVETTTKGSITGGGNENTAKWPFGDKNFFAIITNAMKNFTANVSFY